MRLRSFCGRPKSNATVEFYCDSKSAVGCAGELISGRGLRQHWASEYDVFSEVQLVVAQLRRLHVDVAYNWVKGHQDKEKEEEEMDRETLLNIYCNVRAGMFQAHPPMGLEPQGCSPWYPADKASLMVGGVWVTRNVHVRLVEAHGKKALLKYTQGRTGWSNATLGLVKWHAVGPALRLESIAMRVRVIKFSMTG